MSLYRKKPVEIEAVPVWKLFVSGEFAGYDLPQWLLDALQKGDVVTDFDADVVHVATLEGTMIAQREDFILQGVEGEIYPCKGSIFRASYDQVSL